VGSSVQAGPLLSATWSQTLQGVDLTLTNNGASCTSVGANLVQQVITCPSTGLGATGTAVVSDYVVSLTMPAFALNQFKTGGIIDTHTKATFGPASQVISGNDSSANATMGIPGKVTVRVAAHVAKGVNASKLAPAPTTLVRVPLSAGKAGTFGAFFYAVNVSHYITVDFYAWTPHTLTFTGLTTKGAALPTVVAMGSFGLTDMGRGTVTLVAPSKISIDGLLLQRRTVSFATLTLTFPEPSTLLLLGAGVAGLALIRKRS